MVLGPLFFVVTVGSLLVSPNLLFALGIGYSEAEGSQYLKIHPATYLVALLWLGCTFFRVKNRAQIISNRTLTIFIAGGFALVAYCVLMRFSVSIVVVSLLTPLLVLHVAQRLSDRSRWSIYWTLRLVILANSIVGIYEILIKDTVLPRVAAGVLIETEQRAIGLVGHALPSSMLAGLSILYLIHRVIYSPAKQASRIATIGEMVIHMAALVAFGGRLVIVATALLVVWIVLFGSQSYKVSRGVIVRRILLFLIFIGSAWFLASAEFAQSTIARFLGEQGAAASTESRLAPFLIVTTLDPSEWLWGINASRRIQLMELFDTNFGIEITWIAWVLSFGVIWAALATWTLAVLLFKILRRWPTPNKYLVALFLLGISGSQGLGGKTMLLSWFFLMLITYPTHTERLVTRRRYAEWS
ncbi:MAG: hypothetical protein K0S57_1887 [Ramlibacter sp.]|jgi:hypothetical protein|nr:hypothetical protein [Ramlibacter sp.]